MDEIEVPYNVDDIPLYSESVVDYPVLLSSPCPGKSTNGSFDLIQSYDREWGDFYHSAPHVITGVGFDNGDIDCVVTDLLNPRQTGKTRMLDAMLKSVHLRRIAAEYSRLAIRSYGNKKRFGRTVPSIRFATTLDGKRIRMRKSESKSFLRWRDRKSVV